jgi:photosystem II stability/assembly factor-like uncharacterized protein
MKTKILLIAFLMLASTRTKAQWAVQFPTLTDTLSNVFCTSATNCWACGSMEFNWVAFHTTDGGSNWNPFTQVLVPFAFHFTDANTGYLSSFDTIFKTTNGGANWTPHAMGTGDWIGFSIYFYNSMVGYAAGFHWPAGTVGIYHTSDAGATWTASVSGGTVAQDGGRCFAATSATTCYNVGFNGSVNGVNKTSDGGITWTNIFSTPEDITSVFFTNSTTGFICGGSPEKIYRTTDSGVNWNSVYTGSGGFLNCIYFIDANTGYAVGDQGSIIKTIDGGTNWNPMTSPTTKDLRGLYFPTANAGYAVGKRVVLKYNGTNDIWENFFGDDGIVVSPNPFVNQLSVKTILPKGEIIFFDISGKEILRQTISSEETILNTEKLSAGFYILNYSDGEKSANRKVVKN